VLRALAHERLLRSPNTTGRRRRLIVRGYPVIGKNDWTSNEFLHNICTTEANGGRKRAMTAASKRHKLFWWRDVRDPPDRGFDVDMDASVRATRMVC
jgi:hypothetical protein